MIPVTFHCGVKSSCLKTKLISFSDMFFSGLRETIIKPENVIFQKTFLEEKDAVLLELQDTDSIEEEDIEGNHNFWGGCEGGSRQCQLKQNISISSFYWC